MFAQLKQFFLFFFIFWLTNQELYSQHSSWNNYTGAWETHTSWSPTWYSPSTYISGYNIYINGYITVNGSLTFSGPDGNLIINDTLVIKGDLNLDDKNSLTINNNGILIVRGNLTIDKHAEIETNGYLIVTGNIIKGGPVGEGTFTSNDNPVKVFVGGTIPSGLTDDNHKFPALNCTDPPTSPYPSSDCSHGNMTDLMNDPIYSFFQTTCTISTPVISAGGPTTFCAGGHVTLTSSFGTTYLWSTGAATPSITVSTTGSYSIIITNSDGCQSSVSESTVVTVKPLSTISITSSNDPMCENGSRILTGNPTAGTFTILHGPGKIIGNSLIPNGTGTVYLEYDCSNVCGEKATQNLTINKSPVVFAGHDQILEFIFDTQLDAELSHSEIGEWAIISGSGYLDDIHSPKTLLTGLSIGKNTFQWTVSNGSCESKADVDITVNDLFVPSVITPNNDGKNDIFKIGEIKGQAELIIINRWGNEEYTNNNYLNDWDGRNNAGLELPNDTYFYILKFENGKIKKSSVLIKR